MINYLVVSKNDGIKKIITPMGFRTSRTYATVNPENLMTVFHVEDAANGQLSVHTSECCVNGFM